MKSGQGRPPGRPTPEPAIGASAEVLLEHARQHPCRDDAGADVVICPCGGAAALVCDDCREPVYVVVLRTDGVPCEHARELMGGGR